MTDTPAPWWLPAIATPALTAIAYLLAAERRSVLAIVAAVELSQLALHEIFSAATPAAAAGEPVLDPMCGDSHPVVIRDAVTSSGMHHGGGTGMLIAHVVAGIGAGLWLNLAERISWQLLRTIARVTKGWVRGTIRRVVVAAPANTQSRVARIRPVSWSIRHQLIGRCIPRRGPPTFSLHSATALV